VRINAAARQHGLPYNRFIAGLLRLGITLDRKVLADIAVNQPLAFATLAYQVRGEAMPDEVRVRYGGAPAAPARPRRAARRAPAEEAAPADVDDVQEQPEAALATDEPEAALATEEPEATVTEVEAEESGNAPDHAGTEDRPEEGHGDSEQGTSR
jgi:hypothetical protein